MTDIKLIFSGMLTVLISSLLLISFEVNAMAGIFGSNTLFSEVEGIVMVDGKPCINAKIEQKVYKSNSEEVSNSANTDENGYFSYPEISEKRGFSSLLPSEFVATQRLMITYEGTEYLGWANTKRSAEPNSESNGKPFALVCDLSKAPEEDDKYTGLCRLK